MKKKIVIGILIVLVIIIILFLNVIKQNKMEPYIGYWKCEREDGSVLCFQFLEDGSGFYEFPGQNTKINYFDWSVKDNKAVLSVGEGEVKINFEFEFNENGELDSKEMPGPYKKIK